MLMRTSSGHDTGDASDTTRRVRPTVSLAFKLALLAVAPFVLLSTVLVLGVTYQFERLSDETIGKQEMEFSAPVVQELDLALRSAHEALAKGAERLANLPDFGLETLQASLEREDQLLSLFSEGLEVGDPQQRVLASVGPIRERRLQAAGYSFPKPSGRYLVSAPFEALSTPGDPAVAQSVPLVSGGQIRGYLSGAADLYGARYLGPYRSTRFGESGYYSLTTPERTLILHGDPTRILQYGGPSGINQAIDRGLEGFEGWLNTTTAAGVPMITAVRRVPSSGWVLAVNYPKQVAQMPFLTARRDLVLAVVVGAAVLLGLVLFLARRIIRPLQGMKRQVEALANGTSAVPPLPIEASDEIGLLSEAFNRLVQERSANEEELRASEERFRLAFRTSPGPMAMIRLNGGAFVAVNDGFEQLFGVNEEELLGRTIDECGIQMDADGRKALGAHVARGGAARDTMVRATTPGGRTLDLAVSSNVVNVRGVPHLLTMSRDVTVLQAAEAERERLTVELRTSEERHRRVVRNVPVVQWALDNDGIFTLAEGLGLVALGHCSEQMVGSNLFDLYANNVQILQYFAQAKDGQRVSGPFEHGAAAFDSHWGPLRDESGRIVGVTAIALDVTERQRAERAQRETESRLGVLERLAATGRLAAGVAHEINNPLTYVLSNLEEIQNSLASVAGTDAIRRCADEAMDGASRVAAIVRDLRVFSGRLRQGQPQCEPAKVADSAIALVRNQIRHRARLEIDCQPTPEAGIDGGRLAQVLVNLLMNACQAIPEGNVEGYFVRLRVRYESPWILAEVSDNGEGIAPEVLPHLFEPFFTTRAVGEGSGLGLSVSYAIVAEVGGSIEVQSAASEGATFVVRLPVSNAAPLSKREPIATLDVAAPRDAQRLHILVIDDEPLVGRAVARHLREHCVTVELRARAALERLRRGEQFHAILTDMMMPEMSGIQLYEQLRHELPDYAEKVMFMSGGTFGPEAQAFMANRKICVYEKPLDLALLSADLQKLASASPYCAT